MSEGFALDNWIDVRRIKTFGNVNQAESILPVLKVKEKIQNVERRIKKATKNEEPYKGDHNHLIDEIDKIFNEEIGEEILKK